MNTAAVVGALGKWADGDGPVYRRLSRALAAAIDRGEIEPGSRLPAERVLADALAVSRTTVVSAYEELRAAERVESRRGSGTRVRGSAARGPGLRLREDPSGSFRRHPVYRSLVDGPGDTIEFLGAHLPAPDSLPRELARVEERALRELARGPGYLPMGLPALRQAIARHLTGSGVPTTDEQVLVTHGAQQAIGLAGALFLERGDAVVVEDPTYLGSIDIFAGLGARLVPVPVGGDAAWLSRLKNLIAAAAPRLVYLMPTFHNPTGAVMPESCRRGLARLAREMRVPIVEDNTLADLSLSGRAPAPIAAFDTAAPILTIGSLSKLFWGGLRIGWIRGSEELLARITRLKIMADLGGSLVGQLGAVRLLSGAERVKQARRREMRERLDRLTQLLSRHLPSWRWEAPAGGLSLWVRLPRGDANAFAQVALRHGVAVVPGSLASSSGGCADRLRLPFVLDAAPMKEGVERLARAWAAYAGEDAARRRSAGVLV
ncbi:MAG TPA: PLP-dependent aminotransferase family protein [Thermoanaerobaculia bacterium]|nr:PLP-dependent aminotransferase family protein [Thermoanaerobaculia bacterium]